MRQEGFGPPTIGFVVRYSIQLSYWRNSNEKALYPEKSLCTSGFCLFERLGNFLPHFLDNQKLALATGQELSSGFSFQEIDLIFRWFHLHSGDNIDLGIVLDLQIGQFRTFFVEQILGNIKG